MELPPWQSVQPSRTVPLGCIVGSSIGEWHVRQPADLLFASSGDRLRPGPAVSWRGNETPLEPAISKAVVRQASAAIIRPPAAIPEVALLANCRILRKPASPNRTGKTA